MLELEEKSADIAVLLRRISWRLIPFLLVLYIVSYLDRINLSFAALEMNAALKFSDQVFGMGAGIYFIGYCVFGIPSNLIIKRFGPRRWISFIMVVWGLVTLMMCSIKDANTFYLLRFVLGAAEAGFFPGMLYYLTTWFPPRQYGVAVARFMSAIPLAGLLGSFVAARAFELSGMGGIAGWQWLFLITGFPAIALGLCVFFFLPDSPHQVRWLSKQEADRVTSAIIGGSASAAANGRCDSKSDTDTKSANFSSNSSNSSNSSKSSKSCRFFSGLIWRFALLYFSSSVCMYGFQLWLPQIIKTFGYEKSSLVALLAAIPALFQAGGMLTVAASSDRYCERRLHIVGSSVLTGTGCLIAAIAPGGWLKLMGLSIAAFGIWGTVGPFWALARACLGKDSAAGIAFINSVGAQGGFVGPDLIGRIKALNVGGDFNAALYLLASTAVLTSVLAITSPREPSQY